MWEVRTFAPAFGNEAGAAAEAAHLPLREVTPGAGSRFGGSKKKVAKKFAGSENSP